MVAPRTTREALLSLPEPLRRLPPRDLRYAAGELARQRRLVRGSVAAVAFFPVLLLSLIWFQNGTLAPQPRNFAIAAGMTALASVFLWRQWWNLRQSAALFRDGLATTGILRSVFTSRHPRGLLSVNLIVDFTDATGISRVAELTSVGGRVDVRQGDRVPLLVLLHAPKRVAAYTPGLGLAPGRVRR